MEELEGTQDFEARDSEDGQWAFEYGEVHFSIEIGRPQSLTTGASPKIEDDEFEALLRRHGDKSRGVFYDLGSGVFRMSIIFS